MIPYGLPQDKLNSLLSKTSADHVIAEAGILDLDAIRSTSQTIKDVIVVTQPSSQHMGWAGNPPSGLCLASWHDLVQRNHRSANSEVLPLDKDSQVPPVSTFYPAANGGYELVKYTSEVRKAVLT